jgi:hypothetical protein
MPDTATAERPVAFESRERAALAAATAKFEQLSAHLADTRQRASAGIQAALAKAYDDRASRGRT